MRQGTLTKMAAYCLMLVLASVAGAASMCPPDSQMDIVFAIDSDGSTGKNNYQAFYDFIKEVMSNLPVSTDGTRVGIVTFDTNPPMYLKLTGDRDTVIQKLQKVDYRYNSINTVTTLNAALSVFRSSVARQQKVKEILVLVTDGKSGKPDSSIRMADNIKNKEIQVFTMGVQPRIDPIELAGVASRPDFYLEAPSYADLYKFVQPLLVFLCEDSEREPDTECTKKHVRS